MSELEKSAQLIAEETIKHANLFPLQGDKVEFLLEQLNQIASLPQLTIPKSIADELDKYYKIGFEEMGEADHWLQEHGITKWMCGPDYIKNSALFDIYLAGKALGVDLVKVVEND